MSRTPSKNVGLALQESVQTDFGPKMQALPKSERDFVIAWFHTGDQVKAAQMAGYSDSSSSVLANAASRLWHRPRIQDAVTEFATHSVMRSGIPVAINAILEIAKSPGHKDQAKAAAMILDRTGFHVKTESMMTVTHEVSNSTRMKKFIESARLLGKDPREFLGEMSDVTDADYEEIDQIMIEDGRDGLEDLL